MFKNAKVGDRVWSLLRGWGTVDRIDQRAKVYPYYVKFDIEGADWFTSCGRDFRDHINPTLFWDKVKITPPEKPQPNLAVDTPILVRDEDYEDWRPAHFARFSSEGVVTWLEGRTSHTNKYDEVLFWEQWKLP